MQFDIFTGYQNDILFFFAQNRQQGFEQPVRPVSVPGGARLLYRCLPVKSFTAFVR